MFSSYTSAQDTKIGVSLIFIGVACLLLSLMMFLDRGFLIIANFSFLMGVVALIGPKNTVAFFTKKSKLTSSIVYFAGLFIIIIGWRMFTLLGFGLQLYGIFMLFRSFIKTLFAYCQTLPVIGPLLRDTPQIHSFVNYISSSKKAWGDGSDAKGSSNDAAKSKKYEV